MTAGWDYGAVAFLDILGFASFVEEDAGSTSPSHLSKLMMCLEEARNTAPLKDLDLRSFSDSIILSSSLEFQAVTNLLLSVVGLQQVFIRHGVLVRGGVALGKHFADGHSIYSEALVKAYQLERDHARFPRVICDHNLLDWYMNDEGCGDELKKEMSALLMHDRDGRVFAHYLTPELIEAHSQLINSYQASKVTATVLEKIQWLAAYHNHVAAMTKVNAVIDGPLVAGFKAY